MKNLENNVKPKKVVKKKTVSWSNKKEVKLKRKIKRSKKELVEKKRKNEMEEEDLNDLQNDFKLLKKFKKRKIDEETFDKEFLNENE